MKARRTANDCRIVCKSTITMQLDELIKETFDIVEGVWTVGMPGELHALNRSSRL